MGENAFLRSKEWRNEANIDLGNRKDRLKIAAKDWYLCPTNKEALERVIKEENEIFKKTEE
jgi:hypothetical protein